MNEYYALSIRQPWPWAIFQMGKPVENRPWWTKYRGPFFIHAAQTFDAEAYLWLCNHRHRLGYRGEMPRMNDSQAFPLGGIVGISEVTDCVKRHSSPFFFGPNGFVLRHTRIITPTVPLRGQLGFFKVPREIAEKAMELMQEIAA